MLNLKNRNKSVGLKNGGRLAATIFLVVSAFSSVTAFGETGPGWKETVNYIVDKLHQCEDKREVTSVSVSGNVLSMKYNNHNGGDWENFPLTAIRSASSSGGHVYLEFTSKVVQSGYCMIPFGEKICSDFQDESFSCDMDEEGAKRLANAFNHLKDTAQSADPFK